MLKQIQTSAWMLPCFQYPVLPVASNINRGEHFVTDITNASNATQGLNMSTPKRAARIRVGARRRVRYDNEDDSYGEEEEYGHNEELALLELYSQSARGEALVVHAVVDGQEVEVLIFKGFSSCLSYGTCPDLSTSVLPARAVIKSVDRIKGPFDPSNIEFIEKGLSWETFKSRL